MPTYEYECEDCKERFDEVRLVKDRNEEAKCACGGIGRKVFTKPMGLCVGTFKEGYNAAFGKHFSTKAQLTNELARIKGETGQELVEIGNDRVNTKKQRKKVDWEQYGKDLKKAWKKNNA